MYFGLALFKTYHILTLFQHQEETSLRNKCCHKGPRHLSSWKGPSPKSTVVNEPSASCIKKSSNPSSLCSKRYINIYKLIDHLLFIYLFHYFI